MTLSAEEKTVHDGQPREFYDFELDGGDVAGYYLTDYHESISVFGNTYQPVRSISRSAIRISSGLGGTEEITVNLPHDHPLVSELCLRLPPRAVRFLLRRYHVSAANWAFLWAGEVSAAVVVGREASITIPSIISLASTRVVPSLVCDGICNHILYDSFCDPTTTLRSANSLSGITVSSIDPDDARIITVSSVASAPNQTYKSGELVRSSDGEDRTVLDQTGSVITVDIPFRTLSPGDSVVLYKGCDHKIETCLSKFNNKVNFGGFTSIPSKDMFRFGTRGSMS